ncbi:hypothetical protein L9F63_008419, partial [Diploptera punctata]
MICNIPRRYISSRRDISADECESIFREMPLTRAALSRALPPLEMRLARMDINTMRSLHTLQLCIFIFCSSSSASQHHSINMKLILAVLACASIAVAQRGQYTGNLQQVPILAYNNEVNFDGTYRYNYETGNGIAAQEQGYLKNPGQKDLEAQVATGSYSYTGPDGVLYTITYTADENGFQAQGAHLPTPPPIPEAIARSLNLQTQPNRPASSSS